MNKIKTLGKMCVVIGVLVGLLFSAACAEHAYSKEAIIIDVIGNNFVIIEDDEGYIWEIYADNLHIGEKVMLVVDDSYTENIYDDMIVDIY